MPFIFCNYDKICNYDKTDRAICTLAHEAGHFFHSYENRGEALLFALGLSEDIAEIHSIGMEYSVIQYMDKILSESEIPFNEHAGCRIGSLEPDKDADIAIFDANATTQVHVQCLVYIIVRYVGLSDGLRINQSKNVIHQIYRGERE